MAAATKRCKVCGREYEYCHTVRNVAGVFRWQDVACSKEHGRIYLERIMASRSQNDEAVVASETSEPTDTQELVIADDDDELFEEDFDDNAEEPVIETK